MLKKERLEQITKMLHTNGIVEVSNLCRIFNVTEMTIRRDLNDLAAQKIALRSHGGAILQMEDILAERPYDLRIQHKLQEKEAIAKEALKFIKDGCRIFFDNSTTVYCLARLINNSQKFLAVTDTPQTAIELNARSNVRVVLLGGELKKSTGSCTGFFIEEMLKSMHFDMAFIGLPNISSEGLLTTSSMSELSIKRRVFSISEKVIALADSSKLGALDFLEIGQIEQIYALITDNGIDKKFVSKCKKMNVKVVKAVAI